MMADTTEVAQQTIGDIVANVSNALTDAVKQYGPDAVDLAMLAYRVDAVQTLAIGFLCLAAIAISIKLYLRFWKISEEFDRWDKGPARAVIGVLLGFMSLFLGVFTISCLLNAPIWLAAFGRPEVLIATKALKAAGLM